MGAAYTRRMSHTMRRTTSMVPRMPPPIYILLSDDVGALDTQSQGASGRYRTQRGDRRARTSERELQGYAPKQARNVRPVGVDAKIHRMKKQKHEAELFKAALQAGVKYAEGRGAVEFEPTDSASDKALYVYRLLVHDKIIAPMPEEQVAEKTIRHRLATWYAHQLPKGHPLLD